MTKKLNPKIGEQEKIWKRNYFIKRKISGKKLPNKKKMQHSNFPKNISLFLIQEKLNDSS